MKKALCVITTLALLLVFSAPSYAWNGRGHMMVAAVAYGKLTAKTKRRVAELIGRNPDFDKFLDKIPDGTTEATKQKILFMIAATWPDMIKSDAEYHNDGPDKGGNVPPTDGSGTTNTGYDDKARHKYWHFVDVSFPAHLDTPEPNAQDRIEAFISVLSGPQSPETEDKKSYDLCWLLHILGDVHQPLHCVTRTSGNPPKGDTGGNDVHLTGSDGNLHSFWDGAVGTSVSPMSVITAAGKLPAAPASQANDLNVADWVKESVAIAQNTAYHDPIGAGTGPFAITPAYRTKATSVAKQRIALAGARLANILNKQLQ